MEIRRCVLLWITSALLISCSLHYEDVSGLPEYSQVIGRAFSLQSELIAYGVTTDVAKKGVIDFVVIRKDLISGPEIVFSRPVPRGSIIEVEQVFVARGLWQNHVEYRVNTQWGELNRHTVLVRVTEAIDNGNYGLNRELFSLRR